MTEYTEWECDGCNLRGTLKEVEEHINTTNDGVEIEDIKCWGAMGVGSPVWLDYHVNNVHPMTYIVAMAKEAAQELGFEL